MYIYIYMSLCTEPKTSQDVKRETFSDAYLPVIMAEDPSANSTVFLAHLHL